MVCRLASPCGRGLSTSRITENRYNSCIHTTLPEGRGMFISDGLRLAIPRKLLHAIRSLAFKSGNLTQIFFAAQMSTANGCVYNLINKMFLRANAVEFRRQLTIDASVCLRQTWETH